MKRHARILAGTAIGLVMATSPLAYAQVPAAVRPAHAAAEPNAATRYVAKPFILVQAEPEDGEDEEEAKRRQKREGPAEAGDAEPAPAESNAKPKSQPKAAPAEEAAPEQRPAEPEAKPEAAPRAAEPAPRSEPAPEAAPEAEAPKPRAEPEPAPEANPAPATRDAPAEEPGPQAAPERPAAEQPASEQPEEGQTGEGQSDQGQPEPRSVEPPADAGEPADGGRPPADATPEDAPRPEPAPQVAPEAGAPEHGPRPQAPAADGNDATPAAPAEEPRAPEGGQQDGAQPDAAQPGGDQPAEAGGEPQRQGAAPVLDSQKEQAGGGETPDSGQPATGERPAGEATADQPADQPAEQPAEAGPPPADDSAAQEQARPQEIVPVTQEEGRRIEGRPEDRREERPEGAEVLREIGDRIVIRIDNRIIVESNDRPRIARGARDVYYEELPRGRTREIIVRENGVQIVTIRDRYGDVIRRSRIMPDGREYVLVYVEDNYYERVRDWRDPGRDLPPMRLTIPVEEYILDAGRVRDADAYYAFLDQPPVERVERLYSIDEVKRSARIRDKTRRVDLDTITFEFGSASIAESEIARLEGVAQAIERLLDENPAETFLIEGHTDAVGSDIANLALSDRRAEAVAEALTSVFAIPPENLATQGYGEQYLKVKTEAPERENRRVAIRRITPLVAPVASAQ